MKDRMCCPTQPDGSVSEAAEVGVGGTEVGGGSTGIVSPFIP